jgi:hypothetical protein
MDDFFMFFQTTVVPLASYNAELASLQADLILKSFCRSLLQLSGSIKLNQCGIINLYLDYCALQQFVLQQ